MDYGTVLLPDRRWEQARADWQLAEQLGFAHAWTYDHLSWRALRDGPWFSAFPTLVAAACTTSRMKLGALVASPNFRHPLTLAKELVALDDVSQGRAVAGLGAGGTGWDATVLGGPRLAPGQRAERFAEFVTLTDLLLRRPAATWTGTWYSVEEARTLPGCVQQPRLPLAVAAGGPRTMRLAARYGDYWVTIGPTGTEGAPLPAREGAAAVGREIALLEQACAAEGRDPLEIRRLVLTGLGLAAGTASAAQLEDTAGHYQAVGVTDLVVHWPRRQQPFAGDRDRFIRAVSAVLGTT